MNGPTEGGPYDGAHRPVGGQRFWRADYQRRERQRQMKNDEARPSPEAAREELFPRRLIGGFDRSL